MIRILVFLIFIFNIQCLSDFGERIPPDSSQSHNENYDILDSDDDSDRCRRSKKNCSDLDVHCLDCAEYPSGCTYGDYYPLDCEVRNGIECEGDRKFVKQSRCQYCYQTEKWEHTCVLKNSCTSVASPPQYYKTNCTVHSNIMCLGSRRFPKKLRCNWTRGHKWSTALILSITLGGFGADRFYLGHWQEGIGKLFSFGGLGVWTLVDVLLIAIRYLGPADGSFYV